MPYRVFAPSLAKTGGATATATATQTATATATASPTETTTVSPTATATETPTGSFLIVGLFCRHSGCPGGPEPLLTGQPAYAEFTIDPVPTEQMTIKAYLNGEQVHSFIAPEPPYPANHFNLPEIGTFDETGVLRLDIYAGDDLIGGLSANVTAP